MYICKYTYFLGYSTNIPNYNPTDIIHNLRRIINGDELVPMHPWYRGFQVIIVNLFCIKYDIYLWIITNTNIT